LDIVAFDIETDSFRVFCIEDLSHVPAIIIKKTKLGEADRILTLYTPDLGKIQAVAKGVRRPKSKLAGHLELLTHSLVSLARGRNLDTITGSQTINSLVEAFTANRRGIIIPVYRGRRGNPVIFAIRYKGELLNLKGDVGGREIIKRHPDDVLEVAVNCKGVLLDVDTMEDYNCAISGPDK
jgi:hypothetical protein